MSLLHRRALIAGATGLVLAGCSDIVGPPPAAKLYVLKATLPAPAPGPKVAWALTVQTPESGAGLAGERIAILRPPAILDYYAASAWADPLPAMVQAALLEAFETSARLAAVARDSDGTQSDYILSTDLRDFEARYDQGEGAPLAVVRLGVRLIQARTRKVAGYVEIAKEARASANTVDAAVAALGNAFSAVLADLVVWALGQPAPV
jgi:cholesterol transport system auxiliary component